MTRPNATDILDLLAQFGIDGAEIPVDGGLGDDGYVKLLWNPGGSRLTGPLGEGTIPRSEVHPWPDGFPLDKLRARCGTLQAILNGIVWRQS